MTATRVIAQAPFDDTEANIVLRTSDNIDFYVYRDILKVASPFFRALFSLPHPPPVHSLDPNPDPASLHDGLSPEGLPIVSIPEDSESFDYILRICYPIHTPKQSESLPIVERALSASLKYEIDRATQFLMKDFVRLGTLNPFWMYMVACRLDLKNEAESAATVLQKKYYPSGYGNPPSTDADFVRIATEVYSDGFEQLPAIHLYRLLRHICFGDDLSFHATVPSSSEIQDPLDNQELSIVPFDVDIMGDHPPDILLKSSDGITIPVHRFVLRLASANFITTQSETSKYPQHNGVPMVSLPHPAQTLIQILRACYFSFDPTTTDHNPDDDIHLYVIAQSYGMRSVANMFKLQWLSHAHATKDTLGIYLVSCLHGWNDEAWRAARQLVTHATSAPISSISIPEMNIDGSTSYYYALLKSIHRVHQVEAAALQTSGIFQRKAQETWNDLSYACTPSISPAVAFRALQTITSAEKLVDPAHDKLPSTTVPGFCYYPALFIRRMVSESERFNRGRQEAISVMGT
ncbi:hypothetical protein QCA50_009045 [Cerrena zonata]|uniref:BTB domain-containing protein n=1 Tax=Cerrena zonata TaxID=2478898 RepID=A0AAW0GDY7_9APHY